MSFEFIFLFAMTVFVVSIIPGPSMLLALTHGMYYGARRSLASALGSVMVTFIQCLISVVGLGAVLIASETAFLIIKWGGAAYLLYVGLGLFLAKGGMSSEQQQSNVKTTSLRKMFWQSALVAASNPKAIIFFTAVFPQFINPEGSLVWQSVILTTVCTLVAFVCFMIYVLSGQKLIALLSRSAIQRYFRKVIGGTFIGSGVALAFSHR